ncbi:MAG: hypothetical protein KF726_19725 [Anaerolineae bacterium]|nr:hypothetical protein [Anaerolineae bacterium]
MLLLSDKQLAEELLKFIPGNEQQVTARLLETMGENKVLEGRLMGKANNSPAHQIQLMNIVRSELVGLVRSNAVRIINLAQDQADVILYRQSLEKLARG